ncbi:conserved hypothetical protein [Candidatus Desulfosporosinus infrequens]|uniref:Uncharacterized protein n=1 Tax=Candidatus Desulfosporosinus infrequens TaxID=2043169 RepID=A0A2U3KY61_9FIRM|nr:conserved hypothetical protein [Candidatus Desulfosporosinus infrequens]
MHKHGHIISNIEERMISIKSVWANVDLRDPINQERLELRKFENRSFWARLFRR